MQTGETLIEVKDLCKHFRDGTVKALDGVDLTIRKGDVIVIIGPSGSGKSTFLRSLNLLETPTSGSVIVEGTDITKKKNAQGKKIALSEAQPGDILYRMGHVGIYIGGDRYIHAPHRGEVVKIASGISSFTCALSYR